MKPDICQWTPTFTTLVDTQFYDPDQRVASGAVYEPSGPLGDLQLGNGLTEHRGFNDRYFPSDIQVNGASTVLQWLYGTDAVGNILQITDGLDATQNRLYTYQDFQNYLTSGDGPWGTRAWTYDQIGNRLTEDKDALPQEVYLYLPNGASGNTPILDEIQASSATARDYAYGPAGHLERVTAGANEILFKSNAEGRLSRLDRAAGDARSDLAYDGRSFLSRAEAGFSTTIFTDGFEDGDARCWTSVVGDPNPPTPENCSPFPETLPIYSSDGVLLAVTKDQGQTSELTRSYFYFAGRPIAQLDRTSTGTETWRWLTVDHLGTSVMATDLAGTVLWQGGFEPFGGDWSGAETAEIDLCFPGQWSDESWKGASMGSEVYYNVHRWYAPRSGRYARADPRRGSRGLELYNYVHQSPLQAVDPLGLVITHVDPDLKSFLECARRSQRGSTGYNFFLTDSADWEFRIQEDEQRSKLGPNGRMMLRRSNRGICQGIECSTVDNPSIFRPGIFAINPGGGSCQEIVGVLIHELDERQRSLISGRPHQEIHYEIPPAQNHPDAARVCKECCAGEL